jgi:hypothetical protein
LHRILQHFHLVHTLMYLYLKSVLILSSYPIAFLTVGLYVCQ